MVLARAWLAVVAAAHAALAAPPVLEPRQTVGPAIEVTETVTTTQSNFSPTTVSTTVLATVFSTIVISTTDFVTTTVTSSDVETATVVHFTTTTVLAKRWLMLPPETAAPLDASPTMTQAHPPAITGADWDDMELIRRGLQKYGIIAKRATTTETQTVLLELLTTIFDAVTSTVISTTTSLLRITSVITTTTYANARTTITVTSTLTQTSTPVVVSDPTTVAQGPTTGNLGPTITNGAPGETTAAGGSGSSGNGGSDSGLSVGAKAGIGAGVGGAGLLVLIAAVVFFIKRRNANKPDVGDVSAGMSEVPVGSPTLGGSSLPPSSPPPRPGTGAAMAAGAGAGVAAAAAAGGRLTPAKPGTTEMDAESAWKPPPSAELGNTSVAPTAELGGDEARPRVPEMDGTPAMGYASGPVQDVYEMPAQNYR